MASPEPGSESNAASDHRNAARGWLTLPAALSIAAGVVIFIGLVWQTGPAAISEGILKVGWMFPVIVALGGLRFLVRAYAWALCVEPPHRLRLRDAFAAVLAGDALGNATPLGPVVGEPAKIAYVRPRLAPGPAVTALAVENLFYTIATAAMIAAGTIALLFMFDLRGAAARGVREYSGYAVIALLLLLVAAVVILWRRPAIVSRWLPLIARPGSRLHSKSGKIRAIEQEIYSFSSRRPAILLGVMTLEATFHALGVVETYVTLRMILDQQPTWLLAFVMETASRLVTVVFKFVPLQLGVAELNLGLMTDLLGLGTKPGVTFSIVRKARVVVWAAVGGILLVRHGISPRNVTADLNLSYPEKS